MPNIVNNAIMYIKGGVRVYVCGGFSHDFVVSSHLSSPKTKTAYPKIMYFYFRAIYVTAQLFIEVTWWLWCLHSTTSTTILFTTCMKGKLLHNTMPAIYDC